LYRLHMAPCPCTIIAITIHIAVSKPIRGLFTVRSQALDAEAGRGGQGLEETAESFRKGQVRKLQGSLKWEGRARQEGRMG
jgi:hypothetical protein